MSDNLSIPLSKKPYSALSRIGLLTVYLVWALKLHCSLFACVQQSDTIDSHIKVIISLQQGFE